eukprot:TRINITY_DN17563_c0_g1_i1.p2 TRINITY_DN17563_c0_g1~~TRINITY_DN17563_c0_g1_i1.p2  ORF type:complete len:236 (+),score=91.51 TRINITY_DN17563_c0_g1_i1:121-828(+)
MDEAVKFLRNPKVAGSGAEKKVAFLAGKGMPPGAIVEAARRAGDAELAAYVAARAQEAKPADPTAPPASPPQAPAPAAGDGVAAAGASALPFGAAAKPGAAKEVEVVVPDVVFALADLAKMKGEGGAKLCLACKGIVYEVDPEFYGAGRGYHAFAGVDCSRHLGKVRVGTQEANQRWQNLSEKQLKTLDEWEAKYQSKYTILGRIDEGELAAPAPPTEKAPQGGGAGAAGGCAQQ